MSSPNVLVTAIVTTHNRLGLLKRTIDSIKSQTYPNIELIVVDDASDDGTMEYCQNQNFKYIRIEKKDSKGGNHARNIGISAASGEYVCFCDDDDYWLPTKVERQLDLILKTGYGFVHCARRLEILTPNGVVFKDRCPGNIAEGDISKSILWNIHCLTTTLFVRKDLLLEVGGFDEDLKAWQEHELTIRLAQKSKTDFVKEPLVVYRVDRTDGQRLTNKYFPWKSSVKQIMLKHKSLIDKLSITERIKIKRLISVDGIGRAEASGLRFRWYWHRILVKVYSIIIGVAE